MNHYIGKAAPRFLLGAALMFWGWQTDYLIPGVILALLVEAAHFTPTRWEFSDEDFSRIWTFCALLLITAAIFSFTANDASADLLGFLQDPNWRTQRNAGNSTAQAVASLIRWQPMIFVPFVAAAAYSSRTGVPLHTISLILRRRWRKATADGATLADVQSVNVSYPYFALCLFSASIHPSENLSYFWGLCALLGWAFWQGRSARFTTPVWGATLALAIGLGYAGQQGLTQLNHYLGTLNPYWFIKYGKPQRFDARQTRTMIGQVGRLKQSSSILLRVTTPEGARPPSLLREASYRGYKSQVWYSSMGRSDFENINSEHPETNQTTFVLMAGKEITTPVNIGCYLPGGMGLLPLPTGTARLENLPAFILQKNDLGSVLVEGPGLVLFDAHYGPGTTIDAPPEPTEDASVPDREKATLAKLVDELGLRGKSVQQAAQTLQTYFAANFNYSTFQERVQGPKGDETPISRFLTTTKRGHCEYFATATVLLLRELGHPARYAVGYAVHENAGKNKFVVRQRDAHAWTMVYYSGTWHDLDTTPASWAEIEQGMASPFQGLSDAWSRIMFEFARIRYGQTHLRTYILWALLPVLGLLAVQIFRKRRKRSLSTSGADEVALWPGLDSELYELEQSLAKRGVQRGEAEPLTAWLARAAQQPGLMDCEDIHSELLRLHYRYRFDPRGVSGEERAALRRIARQCLEAVNKSERMTSTRASMELHPVR